MKSFAFAVAMMASYSVKAATTRVFDPDATNNETNGQTVRVTAETETLVMGEENSSLKWVVKSQTRFYEDEGV